MLPFQKPLFALTAVAVLFGAGAAALVAGEDDEDAGPTPEQVQMMNEALAKSVARGKEIWNAKDLFKKSCASCHDDADKPKLNLATREYSYPAYSRRKKGVVTLHQKINEMVKFNSRGAPLDNEGSDIAALTAYVVSLKAKK